MEYYFFDLIFTIRSNKALFIEDHGKLDADKENAKFSDALIENLSYLQGIFSTDGIGKDCHQKKRL